MECYLPYSNKKYFTSYRSYWSKGWPFSSDNFSSLMSSRRFELILRFLHLNDSATQPQRGQQGFNKLYKIQPLLDLLLPSFKDCYTPSQAQQNGACCTSARCTERKLRPFKILDIYAWVHTLVYYMGDQSNDILRSFKLSDDDVKKYDTVIEKLEDHFVKLRNIIFESEI